MKSKLIKFLLVAFIATWMALILISCSPPPEYPPGTPTSTDTKKEEEGPLLQGPQTQMKDDADRQDRIIPPAGGHHHD